MKVYSVEFYSKMRGEVLTVNIEAPDRNMAVDGVCRYYMADKLAVRSVKETPDAEPKCMFCRVPSKSL